MAPGAIAKRSGKATKLIAKRKPGRNHQEASRSR